MSLNSKQDEWSNLLSVESIKRPLPHVDMFKHLNVTDRFELSATWVCEGIHARHTDYPKTSDEIKYFKWSRSALMRGLFNCAAVIQIFSTFLDNTSCDHEYALDSKLFYSTGAPTRLALTIFDLLCLGVYLFELYLQFAVNPKQKSLLQKPWSTFRLLICLFVLLDCLIYFIDPTQPRLMRCVYPFLLISKRNNLKLMVQGLLISAYKSLPIIKALVTILVMWGFAGFFFFRATDADNLAFNSPGSGIAEALHCFTSRPYVLKALDSIYPNDQASALYFVTLTLAADILCIGLIVATGAKHYKQFAGQILHSRLVDRRHATRCAFYALTLNEQSGADGSGGGGSKDDVCVDSPDVDNHVQSSVTSTNTTPGTTPTISRQTWLDMCACITGKYATTTHTANFIFDLVVDSDIRDVSVFRSVYAHTTSTSSSSDDDNHTANTTNTNYTTSDNTHVDDFHKRTSTTSTNTNTNINTNSECMDEYLFFRVCALLATRIAIQVDETATTTTNYDNTHNNGSMNSTNVSVDLGEGQEEGYELPRRSSAVDTHCHNNNTTTNSTTINNTNTADAERPRLQSVTVNAQLEPGADPSTLQVVVGSSSTHSVHALHSIHSLHSAQTAYSTHATPTKHATTMDALYAYILPIQAVCVQITGAQVTVGGGKGGEQYTISLFYAVRIFLLLLMVIDLCFLSSSTRTLPAFHCACVLECCFWVHLLIRIVAVGARRFVSFYENRGDTLLNIASLITIIKLGQEYTTSTFDFHSSLALGWYLLIQCARLFKLFFVVNDVRIFEHMRPVLVRASFIYFSVIYFFSIFAYSYFCNAMNVTDAQNTSPSNDASQWVQYANLLNFNTLLQSLFTLFQLSLLGNWSIVMDAAVASTSHPASAYIFFYTYRLCITLFVLPILLSFLIQVFLSALSAQEKEREMKRLLLEQSRLQAHTTRDTNDTYNKRRGSGSTRIASSGAGRVASTTQVSYNVNQEVLLLGRGHHYPHNYPGGERLVSIDSDASHAYYSHMHSVDSIHDTTMSPVHGIHHGHHSPHDSPQHSPHSSSPSSRSASPVRSTTNSNTSIPSNNKQSSWRPSVSIRLNVNRAAATQVRDKHLECVTTNAGAGGAGAGAAHLHARHTNNLTYEARDSEWGGHSDDQHPPTSHQSSRNTSQNNSVDRSVSAPPSPRHGHPTAHMHSNTAGPAKVTVQYDSKGASSMMSIWAIDGNAPTPGIVPSLHIPTRDVREKASPRTLQNESSEMASLRAQLHAAMQALEAEKMKNNALKSHEESLL